MSGVLRAFWRLFAGSGQGPAAPAPRRMRRRQRVVTRSQESGAVFVVLRRLRAPLITLILVFTISVVGLSLVPGQDAAGRPARMSVFDAFYFMSYTATTIGFGELPNEFTYAQRMWVTGAIYLTVVGWAYAIGSVLTLLQDRAFRRALITGHVTRKVARLREPFLLMAGYGQTGEMLGDSFDALGRRFTVVDLDATRIDALELNTSHADVPGLVGDARDLHDLVVAGLDHPWCEGVVALTSDDQANLAVVISAALLRPELPVVARTTSGVVAERMRAFGSPTVINPFDRFGDRLRLALRAPSSYQLTTWLETGPGAELPERRPAPAPGRWVVAGYGTFGRHFATDLRAEGLEVVTIDRRPAPGEEGPTVVGDASDPDVLAAAGLVGAVGFVAGSDDDITNMSLVAEARRVAPGVFVAARQNAPTSAALFAALEVDALLVPTAVVAHEAYAQLSTPLLWRFLRGLLDRDDAWAAAVTDRLVEQCGRHLDPLWKVRLDDTEAPSLTSWLAEGRLRLGDLLRSPVDRDRRLAAVPLVVRQGEEHLLAPGDDVVLRPGDELLLAGRPAVRRALEATLLDDAIPEYLVSGRRVPSGWLWRKVSRQVPAASG
ncbi:potassium channel family protein [Trujillonella endophytica]|uniref:Trk K+ transport system, NAD-binding component n=1 Tax=Trujillonella endophytica TaxID=673521 RepID=A0A1H8Q019_9ACTN|nr:potassium channel protein [Trujillella endophytica]SEO47338.1 Trk K+ transport system, NAD-binding component [Trujillella endophytica]